MGNLSGDQIYGPPRSPLTVQAHRPWLSRFWLTCIVCGAGFPVLMLFVFGSSFPDWAMALLAVLCWLLPVGWVLLPELKQSGLGGISFSHMVAVSAKFFLATALVASSFLVLIGAGFFVIDVLGNGT